MKKPGQGGPHTEAHSTCFHGSHEATLHLHKHNYSMARDLVGHVVLELVLGKAHDSLRKVPPGARLPQPPSALQPFPGRMAQPKHRWSKDGPVLPWHTRWSPLGPGKDPNAGSGPALPADTAPLKRLCLYQAPRTPTSPRHPG